MELQSHSFNKNPEFIDKKESVLLLSAQQDLIIAKSHCRPADFDLRPIKTSRSSRKKPIFQRDFPGKSVSFLQELCIYVKSLMNWT